MRDGHRIIKGGLAVSEHEALSRRLATVEAELAAIRDLIKEHLGSATSSYQSINRALADLRHLRTSLLFEMTAQHASDVPTATLRRVYFNGDGPA